MQKSTLNQISEIALSISGLASDYQDFIVEAINEFSATVVLPSVDVETVIHNLQHESGGHYLLSCADDDSIIDCETADYHFHLEIGRDAIYTITDKEVAAETLGYPVSKSKYELLAVLMAGYDEEDVHTDNALISTTLCDQHFEATFVEIDVSELYQNLAIMSGGAKNVKVSGADIVCTNVRMPDTDKNTTERYMFMARVDHKAGVYKVNIVPDGIEEDVIEVKAKKVAAKDDPKSLLRPMLDEFVETLGVQLKTIFVRVPENSIDMIRFVNPSKDREIRTARIDKIYDNLVERYGKEPKEVETEYGVAYILNIGRRVQIRLSINVENGLESLRGVTLRQLKPLAK